MFLSLFSHFVYVDDCMNGPYCQDFEDGGLEQKMWGKKMSHKLDIAKLHLRQLIFLLWTFENYYMTWRVLNIYDSFLLKQTLCKLMTFSLMN